jgi:chromosomal replication initiation ATPase DnaA
MKLIPVAGARPNFMKIAPIIRAIATYNNSYGPPGVTRKNSIFLYGPTRSGKTTALKTIDDYLSTEKGVKVLRLDAEDLIIELVKSIRGTGDTKRFYHKFHDCDALLVDNVWVLQAKPKTTEQIFLLFTTLIDKGKLLIITLDIPPATLSYGTKAVTELYERSVTIEMKPRN